ncbi:MAG: HEAT repeat domain-containing protein [Candidatus Thorarchaeota archaeon]
MSIEAKKEDISKLITKLSENAREGSRAEAAKALGKMEEEAIDAVPTLLNALKNDKSERVRGRAALALGRIKDTSAIPFLIKSLKEDQDEEVRARVAWALGDFGEKAVEAVNDLWKAVDDDKNAVRKFHFINALANIEGVNSKAITLLEKMKEKNELERWQIIRYQNLVKELNIQEQVKEATEGMASVKDGAEIVQNEMKTLREKVEQQPESKGKDDLLSVTSILQKMIEEQQRTIERQESTIRGLNDSLKELVKAHQQAIQEPRITAEQFQEFKESMPKESWFRRNLPALIGATGTVIGGLAGLLGWLSGFLGWI